MCGIIGVIALNKKLDPANLAKKIKSALSQMNYRGPDNASVIANDEFAFGHVRLSILDLNERSNQPYSLNNENFLVYNGEIYNFSELAEKYSLVDGEAKSDTEVLYKIMNKDPSLISELNGMYAFCFFDHAKGNFHIVRDKYGIKPLYVYQNEDLFIFSSESKLIREFVSDIGPNYSALHEWSFFGSTLGENTFFEGIKKVLPGYSLVINQADGSCVSKQYYKPSITRLTRGSNSDVELRLSELRV